MNRLLNIWLPVMFLIAVYSCDKSDSEPAYPFDIPEGYELVWNDEFDEGQIDSEKWTFETGDGTDFGLPYGCWEIIEVSLTGPGCGEIDIMEMPGHNPYKTYGSIHYVDAENRKGESQGTHETSGSSFSEEYSIFTLVLTPETLSFKVNGFVEYAIP